MLEFIIAALMAMGFNLSGEHFTMNSYNAEAIKSSNLDRYEVNGGDREFTKFVEIDNTIASDIVIIDEIDPKE